jgi:hypothetical protein
MSVEYTIKPGLFSKVDFEEILDGFKKLNPTVKAVMSDDGSSAFFFREGSIRGMSLRRESARHFVARINHCASRADAEMMQDVLLFAIDTYNASVIHEDGKKLKRQDIAADTIYKSVDGFSGFLEAIFAREAYVSLPLDDANSVVYKDEYEDLKSVSNFPQNLIVLLQERAKRLFYARRVNRFQLNDSGFVFSVWDYDDMLVCKTDLIALQNPSDEKDVIFVDWDDFAAHKKVSRLSLPSVSKDSPERWLVYGLGGLESYEAAEFFVSAKSLARDVIPQK